MLVTISDRKILVKTGSGTEANGDCDQGTAIPELSLDARGSSTLIVAQQSVLLLPGFSSSFGDNYLVIADNNRLDCENAPNETEEPNQYYYMADVMSANDYYPFGMEMVGRKLTSPAGAGEGGYRYGFNGQEKSTEIDPNGNSMTAEFWQYDARLGRRWNIDPRPGANFSSYSTLGNSPIWFKDPKGDTTHLIIYGNGYQNTSNSEHDLGNTFKKQAEALKAKIESSAGFDKSKDEVIIAFAANVKRFLDATNKKYSTRLASLTVFSHGYAASTAPPHIGGVSLGGERAGDKRPDGTIVTKDEELNQPRNYDLREINASNMRMIDNKNFDPNAVVTFYGCFIGGNATGEGVPKWTLPMIKKYSFAQNFANAFSGSAVAKVVDEKVVYYGTMVRYRDMKSGFVNLSEYSWRRSNNQIV